MTFTSEQLQEAVAVATRDIQDTITNQLTFSNYLYYCLTNSESKSKKYISGGTQIQQPIYFSENDSQGFINGQSDILSTNTNQQINFAVFDWKYYYTNVNITLDDFTKTNDTATSIASLLEAKKEGAVSSSIRELTQAMHGSGTDNGGKSFNGLTDIFSPSGVEYAGLTNTDFDDPQTWLTEINTTDTSPNYTNISRMLSILNGRASQYGGGSTNPYKPNIALSNEAVYSKFMSTLQAQQRFSDKEVLKAGFTGQNINGVFWYIDHYTPGSANGSTADNYLYLISTNSLKFFYKYGLDKKSPFDQTVQIPNQPIKSDQMFLAGNIGCTSRRINGVFQSFIA